ncbi:N-acetylmuramoyl-L-alanine amidase [Bacteroides sp. GM023]|uniref:N-acetylmuramoyl-L-alanine amidase n=1 Tax=Bacteroides sp. GM023 TaxID=2723058 RepID=UPI00168B3899|nr:N-acetylmuramoyl-L-alanine amidase [Bacteroides sp. GM023]MBD3589427.1 N-acetylmuramoyl-L-alanine amidase [Bacteroides sp. GM023]
MKILIDNGHGKETPGKCSPDGRLKEYAYTREIADRVVAGLQDKGVDTMRIVPEEEDVSLSERVKRVNTFGKEAILISIHCNAMGNGSEWMSAHGWSVFVGNNASMNSKWLAWQLAQAALNKKVKVRRSSPQNLYWTANLYICQKTNCPAVLVENFFQDNKDDVEFLLSEEGKQCITDILLEGITNYLKEYLRNM